MRLERCGEGEGDEADARSGETRRSVRDHFIVGSVLVLCLKLRCTVEGGSCKIDEGRRRSQGLEAYEVTNEKRATSVGVRVRVMWCPGVGWELQLNEFNTFTDGLRRWRKWVKRKGRWWKRNETRVKEIRKEGDGEGAK